MDLKDMVGLVIIVAAVAVVVLLGKAFVVGFIYAWRWLG